MVNIHRGLERVVAEAKRLPELCPALEQACVDEVTAMRQSRTVDET